MSNVIHDPKSVKALLEKFARTTDEVVTMEELRSLLSSGRKLTIKYGVDVTAPYLHIGHAVNLWMFRDLQEHGHKIVFLIGDFTTRIGDPTGKNKTRPIIPEEEIQKNAEEFIRQALMVLKDDPEVLEIRRNSEWFGNMPTSQFLSLVSSVTLSKLSSRDMFRKRINEGTDIYMHEMLYPILQGYDSVELKSDITIIGSDQLFNEMMGRFYQERFDQKPQVILTTKITPGIDGGAKQSKSLNNYVGLGHTPREKFGRVMSMPDHLVVQYFEVYTDLPLSEIRTIETSMTEDPMAAKMRLGEEIVARYHGSEAGKAEREWFVSTFSNKKAPEDAPEISFEEESVKAYDAVRKCLTDESNSDIRRLFEQNGVKFDDATVGMDQIISLPGTLKVGKRRWFKLVK